MLIKLIRSSLTLVACLLLLTQCQVSRDVTKKPDSTTKAINSSASAPKKRNKAEIQLREDIVDYAKKQLGSRYKYAGRSPKQGFDCSGFTHYVMNNFGIQISPSSKAQELEGKKINLSDAKTGDLIFFRRSKRGAVFHVALVVSNERDGLTVIHSTSRGVVVDNISQSSYWKPKISTARDVIER